MVAPITDVARDGYVDPEDDRVPLLAALDYATVSTTTPAIA